MRLDNKAIARLALPEGKSDAIFFDQDLPGFGLRLRANGNRVRRSFVVQYRHAGGTRRLLLGAAEVLSPEQARAAAKKTLAEVALGGDPQRDKQERRGKDKFSLWSVIDQYLAAKESRVRRRTYYEARRYLIGYFKSLHGMPIDRITRRDVAARLLVITRENGPVVAARARVALSAVFSWSVAMGLAEQNVVVGTPKPADAKPRDRVLSDLELGSILRACNDGSEYGRVVWLLALTGCRRQEVGAMRWDELDLERGIWVIPASRTKNGRVHTLPLGPLALSVLESAPPIDGRGQVFGTRAEQGFTNWALAKRELDTRLGGKVQPWRMHDLRRTLATRLCDLGAAPHVVEQILNHHGHRAGVAGVYNRSSYTNEVTQALQMWATHVENLAFGQPEKVVPFVSRA
jgi:integrase